MWKQISELYNKRIIILNSVFDAKSILDLIIKVYDNDVNQYCCEEHLLMLVEKNNTQDGPSLVSSPFLLAKIEHLLNIVQNIFTSSKVISIDQLKHVIPLLSCELSPCLHKEIVIT